LDCFTHGFLQPPYDELVSNLHKGVPDETRFLQYKLEQRFVVEPSAPRPRALSGGLFPEKTSDILYP
jgi:hypothetical protein